jgi:rubrerythrin
MKEKNEKGYHEAGGEVPSDTSALEALSLAIYNEQSAFDFYTRLSETIKNESGKKKFKFLAMDEHRHRTMLEEHYTKTTGRKEFIFDSRKVKEIKVDIKDGTSAAEALDIGIKAEKEAYEFYSKSATEAKDPEAKKMFLMLAEQEDRHYNLLTAERQAVIGQFYWFDMGAPGVMEY